MLVVKLILRSISLKVIFSLQDLLHYSINLLRIFSVSCAKFNTHDFSWFSWKNGLCISKYSLNYHIYIIFAKIFMEEDKEITTMSWDIQTVPHIGPKARALQREDHLLKLPNIMSTIKAQNLCDCSNDCSCDLFLNFLL